MIRYLNIRRAGASDPIIAIALLAVLSIITVLVRAL